MYEFLSCTQHCLPWPVGALYSWTWPWIYLQFSFPLFIHAILVGISCIKPYLSSIFGYPRSQALALSNLYFYWPFINLIVPSLSFPELPWNLKWTCFSPWYLHCLSKTLSQKSPPCNLFLTFSYQSVILNFPTLTFSTEFTTLKLHIRFSIYESCLWYWLWSFWPWHYLFIPDT